MSVTDYPYLGFGIGLRTTHYQDILATQPKVDWFEILTENYLVPGGRPFHFLDKVRELYPIVMHGVSLSIGSVDALNWDYLRDMKKLIERVEPKWVSDHLTWSGVDDINFHDLMPLPFTEEALDHVVERILRVQDFLGRQIVLENASSYITFNESTMTEWDFISLVAARSDCLILLDINNVYVSGYNHGFDPKEYINNIPAERVLYFHLAGHTNLGSRIIDTHDANVTQQVWSLYELAVERFPHASTLIERDDHIPPLSEMLTELERAREIRASVYAENYV